MKREHNINFANGFQINLYEYKDDVFIALTNHNGFIISEKKINSTDKKAIEDVLKVLDKHG